MAKRKHAAALFEVFNDNRGTSARDKAAAARASRWWFKGRGGTAVVSSSTIDPNDPTTMPIKSPLIAPRIAAVEAMEVPSAKTPAPSSSATLESKPQPQTPRPQTAPAPARMETAPPAPTSPHRFHLDLDHREVTMRLPFTTAVVVCFGIMLAFALAYVTGRRAGAVSSAIPKATAIVTPDDVWSQPVRPNALEVPRRSTTPKPPTAITPQRAVDDIRPHDHDSTPMANSVKGLVTLPKPPVDDGPRIIGLNYMLVQTYPNEALAAEARDFLLKNGVSCTVEKAPSGFAVDPSWYAVISTHGFERIHTPECDNLKHQIEKVGEKFAGNGKFKRFAPQLFKLK